jgi:RNA polymerase sigma-70 factor, ECF subfamily
VGACERAGGARDLRGHRAVICHILLDVGFLEPKPSEHSQASIRSELRSELTSELGSELASESLAERVARGEHAAFVALYRAHAGEIRTFAERLLGCSMAADDLAHEVFLALPSALSRFRGQCPLRSYLLSITVRSARQHLRSAQRRRRLESRAAGVVGVAVPTPDADTEQRELAALLTRALDSLPLGQRAAFVLCEVEERSSQEAAEILGEKPGTVRARVFHAKRKLREELSKLAPGETAASDVEVES